MAKGGFSALQSRLAQGRNKPVKAARDSFKKKTSWSKGATQVGKGKFSASGRTPGLNKPGPGPSSARGTF